MLSIIIPVLNEGDTLPIALEQLQALRQRGCELIGVDGGSADSSLQHLQHYCDQSLQCEVGRARQMNAGAQVARHDKLLFLHADTKLPAYGDRLIDDCLQDHHWGRFDIALDNPAFIYSVIAYCINVRSRWSQVATGDQALFFRQDFFQSLGGFPTLPLMEDVAISKLARRRGRYGALRHKVTTSARRWEKQGTLKTILLMWDLRLRYFLGQSPAQLAQRYYG